MTTTRVPDFLHWKVAVNEKVITLTLSTAESSTNILSMPVLHEFSAVVDWLVLQEKSYQVLLLQSGKKNGFIAGADIENIRDYESADKLASDIDSVKSTFDRFAGLSLTKIALIDGFCLGGGLELALCCDYRVITEKATLALPEVKLGLLPGFAGMARLTRMLSPLKVLPMMLQGSKARGKKAVAMGLADACVSDNSELLSTAKIFYDKTPVERIHFSYNLFKFKPARQFLCAQIRQKIRKKVRPDHYPAPFEILDVWAENGGDYRAMCAAETKSFIKLRQTSQSESLIRLYFLQERLKAFAKNDSARVKHLHVIGAGVMGGDIASWSALQGVYTTLSDLSDEALERAGERAYKLFKKKARQADEQAEVKMRLRLDKKGWGADKADLIIEAAVEKLKDKQKIFQYLETTVQKKSLLATNTSSLKLEDIANGLSSPERLIGIHFFNPVSKMPLVELVCGEKSRQEDLNRAAKFVHQIKRLPLPVKSSPGFLVNRILVPYLYEALLMYCEGMEPEMIDHAAEEFGMPMGPIELADNVGLDVCQYILGTMALVLGDIEVKALTERVEAGKLGRKSGEGFYCYEEGRVKKSPVQVDEAQMQKMSERLIMCYLNACAWCLRHEIVADADLLDAGCVFGTGFAPFRGGPMHYAQQCGYADIVKRLQTLVDIHGERFKPDAWWQSVI